MASLEGWNFTIKLCPRGIKLPRDCGDANSFFEESAVVLSAGTLFLERGRDEGGVVAAKAEGIV